MSYLCSFLVVLVGSIFGLFLDNLNSIIGWIVSGLLRRVHGRQPAQVVLVALQ
jgi:hypothetical protein